MKTLPRNFSHIGMNVKNIEEVVKWYNEVLGFYIIMDVTEVISEKETAIGDMCAAVFGDEYKSFKIAHMTTGDGIGIELFEFPETTEDYKFEPYKAGLFHFSIKDPNIDELVEKIVASGGKQRMPIKAYFPGEKPYRMCYVEDPFGHVFEIYTHSYELHYGNHDYK